MPLYHITLHAYRSWNADHPQGFIREDRQGIQPPNKAIAARRDQLAKHPPIEFDLPTQHFLLTAAQDAATRRNWDLYAITATTTHVHAVISVAEDSDGHTTRNALKSALGFQLAKRNHTKGRPYFSHGGIPERIKDQHHLRHLLHVYLPNHHAPIWVKKIQWK